MDVGAPAVTPVSADPLPMKNPAAMLPVVLTLPAPNTAPAAVMLPVTDTIVPVWLAALTIVVNTPLPPWTLAVALILPEAATPTAITLPELLTVAP